MGEHCMACGDVYTHNTHFEYKSATVLVPQRIQSLSIGRFAAYRRHTTITYCDVRAPPPLLSLKCLSLPGDSYLGCLLLEVPQSGCPFLPLVMLHAFQHCVNMWTALLPSLDHEPLSTGSEHAASASPALPQNRCASNPGGMMH